MPKKKVNPRRRPATQADVEKSWNEGADFGLTFAIKAFLFTLKDKHQVRNDYILQLKDEFTELVEALNRSDITMEDIDSVLESDFDLHVRMF